jgi:hypothetical protein
MKRLLSNDGILSRDFISFPSPLVGEGGSHRRCETGEGSRPLVML